MDRSTLFLATWTLLAGAGIPLIGVLNSGMARSVGNPLGATAVMFAVALLVALGLTRQPVGAVKLAAFALIMGGHRLDAGGGAEAGGIVVNHRGSACADCGHTGCVYDAGDARSLGHFAA